MDASAATALQGARAVPGWQRHWWLVGLVMVAGTIVADAVMDRHMSGTYAGGAVLAAVASTWRRTALVAAVAVLAAAVSGLWNDGTTGTPEWAARLLLRAVLCAVAVGTAAAAEARRSRLEQTTALAQRVLDALAVELTGARTTGEVTEGFVSHAVRTLGARSAMVLSLDPDRVLRSVVWEGRGAGADRFQEVPLDSGAPGAVAARTGTDLHLRSRKEIERTVPDLVGYYAEDRSLHVLPLSRHGRTLGVLALTFPRGAFVATQDGFLRSVAGSLTSALLRAEELQVADAAAQRTSLLAEASLTLSRHLDVDGVLEEVGRLLVPRFADWCSVALVRQGDLRTVHVQHRDPATTHEVRELVAQQPAPAHGDVGVSEVVRSGRSQLHTFLPSEVVDAAAVSAEHRAALQRLGSTSAVIVPLAARARSLGALTLVHADSGRRYDEADLAFVEQLAERVALALDTAATFTRQSERLADVRLVAEAAQHAILAPPPPRVGPVALQARYRSAAQEAQVGGDLYEVVAGADRVRLLVGDVRGKGLAAVRTATIVLGEFRAAAAGGGDLTHVAAEIDQRLHGYLSDPEDFVTAVLVDICHDGRFAVASCGHPWPLRLDRAGRAHPVETANDPPLGLGFGVRPRPTEGRLCPGEALLLFTDGLVEARTPSGEFVDPVPLVEQAGAPRADLPDPPPAPVPDSLPDALPDSLLDSLLERLRRATGDGLDDDLALLLARYRPLPPGVKKT